MKIVFWWVSITSHVLLISERTLAEEGVLKDGYMINGWYLKALKLADGAGVMWTDPKREKTNFSQVSSDQDADFLLITRRISLHGVFADVIYVDFDAELTNCSGERCNNYFGVYIYREDQRLQSFGNSAKFRRLFREHFKLNYNITDLGRRRHTFNFPKDQSQGVTLGIRSNGSCGKIYQIKMYYYYCKEEFVNSVHFSNATAPAHGGKEITANCSINSSPSNSETKLKGLCLSNGTWEINDEVECLCNKGFEPSSSYGCSACKTGHYKPNSSNENCLRCPSNTVSNTDKTGCQCKDGYHRRLESNVEPCFGLPKYKLKLVIEEIGRYAVNITWNEQKQRDQLNETLKYDVTCKRCTTEMLCNASCYDVQYSPGQRNLNKTFVVISNLKPGSTYVIKVYPKNSMNELVGKDKWNYTSTKFSTTTIGKIAKDVMEDPDFWRYIYVIVATCAVIFVTVIVLLIVLLRRRGNDKRELIIMNPNQVELPSIGNRLYIDPTIYDSPEEALDEFASELERSVVVLEMLIGGGEFGDVYKGKMTCSDGTEIDVAVKTLKHDANARSEKDFLSEASVMGQFNDPNVIKLQGVVTRSIPRMIVIEYMSNGSLYHFLQKNEDSLMLLQLIGMARGVASGMKYLAGMNYVHRDLAARNILVNDQLFCKISDFGLSRVLETEGSSQGEYETSGGKIPLRWTAPEAIKYRKFSSASDVWSYGILLWEIMSFSKRPYGEWDNLRVIREVDEGYRLSAPLDCPKAVHDLMLRCWNSSRGERPSFGDMILVIDAWIATPEMLRDDADSSDSLDQWLQSIKMGSYIWHFVAAGYRSPSQLPGLEDQDLREMGITLIGHRNKILKGIKAMESKRNKHILLDRIRTSSVAV